MFLVTSRAESKPKPLSEPDRLVVLKKTSVYPRRFLLVVERRWNKKMGKWVYDGPILEIVDDDLKYTLYGTNVLEEDFEDLFDKKKKEKNT